VIRLEGWTCPAVRAIVLAIVVAIALLVAPSSARAHDGPPFPIVSEQTAGAYVISVWTDPDTTDDGSPGGQFWVTLRRADDESPAPAGTSATVSIEPLGRSGPVRTGRAEPLDGQPAQHFVALPMDHEGRFAVRVVVAGPLGSAQVESQVEATYDLRPSPALLFVFVIPFLLVGFLWLKLLLRRRGGSRA
jgi:hypothetical protein